MASMRDIKRRKSSIQSTQQITKAMKLVSTVKLQRTREKAEECKPYFNHMYATVTSMLARTGIVEHPYLKSGKSGKKGVIVISSNRGLAGGYNSNIVKMLTQGELEGKGYEIAEDYSEVINAPLYSDAVEISQRVLKDFEEEKIGEIYLVYTSFKNTVAHEPKLLKLLPVEFSDKELSDAERNTPMNYKPGEEEALDMIIPKYIASLLYGALNEAAASENGARMQAMDAATSNAEDMMESLELQYNRARQGSITQELTEIIAGAEAVE